MKCMRWVIHVNVANIAYVFRGRDLGTVLIFFRFRASAYTTLDGLDSLSIYYYVCLHLFTVTVDQFCKSGRAGMPKRSEVMSNNQ